VYAGVLGAIVVPTSEPAVPAFDLLATDPWPAADPPAAALCLYNPLAAPLNVTLTAPLAVGESVIKCPSPLNVLKYTYDHCCY
jgi:hypothetical protein